MYLLKTFYNGMRSALRYLFGMSDSEMSFGMKKYLGKIMSRMERMVATTRQATGQKLDEGKCLVIFRCVFESM